jgi:hypothetical protein
MFDTRSARLAALLLLTLLFGWKVRSCRKGATTSLPSAIPAGPSVRAVGAAVDGAAKSSFPDE